MGELGSLTSVPSDAQRNVLLRIELHAEILPPESHPQRQVQVD